MFGTFSCLTPLALDQHSLRSIGLHAAFPASRFEIDDLMEEEQGYEPFSSTPQTAAVWERTEWPTLTRPLAFTAKTLPYANEDDWIGSRTDSHEHSLPSSPVGLQQDRLSDAEELQFGFDCE
eukprot:m.380018 g.380018  ORF g.380018 m.380018 type:complete len:122 (-) comp56222_c0_seq3:4410-4775(-)